MGSSPSDMETLSRVCVDSVCHCDWRLTLRNCAESRAMTIIHGINVGLSGLSAIIGMIKTNKVGLV
jgi:hypothetical protein